MKILTIFSFLLCFSFVGLCQIKSITHEIIENDDHDHDHDHGASQNPDDYPNLLKDFDLEAANKDFDRLGYPEGDRFGYIKFRKMEYLYATFPDRFINKNKGKGDVVIPYKSANCPNAGFEDLTFAPLWTGGTSTYTQPYNNTTIQSNGINAAVNDGNARHTIMTTPPINNNPANGAVIGYDPTAIDPATGIAQISLVAPNGNGSSVRLGNTQGGNQKERLTYEVTVDAQTKAFYYQFAVVLENPSGHPTNVQPFFSIKLFDANGDPVGGPCGVYNVLSSEAASDTSFKFVNGVYYRNWDRVNVDLSPFVGQTISIQFETADCDYGGHFGYAYIDAGCLGDIDATANYCPGDPYAELVAKNGFATYKWYGPNDFTNEIVGQTNDTLLVTSPQIGDSFLVELGTQNGCVISQIIHVEYSFVEIEEFFTENTCFGAGIGAASVIASGSIQGYNYTWSPLGVSTTEGEIDSLFAGQYTLTVSSPNANCGTADTTFNIDFAPVFPPTVIETFCEGIGSVSAPTSNSYQWYDENQDPIPAPEGTSQTIIDSNAFEGKNYYLFYELDNGCGDTAVYVFADRKKDSRIELTQPVDCRSLRSVFIDETPSSDTLTYTITGPGFNNVHVDTTDSIFVELNLATGLYTITIEDEGCLYDTTKLITDVRDSQTVNFDFCPDDEYFLSSIATGQHQWTDPNGQVIGNNANIVISDIIVGTYIDSCLVTPGCYSLWNYNMDSISIKTDHDKQDVICAGGNDGAIIMNYTYGPTGDPIYNTVGPNGYQSNEDSLFGLGAGTYIVTTKLYSCEDVDTVYIFEPNIDDDTLTIYGSVCDEVDATTLYAPSGFEGYQWYYQGLPIDGATSDSLYVTLPANFDDYFILYYIPPNPCKVKTKDIEASGFSFGFVPGVMNNVFTPNEVDDVNSVYYPFKDKNWTVEDIAGVASNYRMIIYNRWGGKIFETTDYTVGWDGTNNGKPVSDGTYFANVTFLPKCGDEEEDVFSTTQAVQVIR